MMDHATFFLEEAAKTLGKRASDRDLQEERSMKRTVEMFNTLYGTNLTETQGWTFMVLLKLVRSATGPYKQDDYVDGPAYFGLAGESRSKEAESTDIRYKFLKGQAHIAPDRDPIVTP
ncbi:hypothetical protein [Rhizobium phage RHph_X2_28B]|uniref:phosphofructokinase n=1 Tax=Rhizobium phage RHph_X2_28B TaxID=2836086 RepID=UPI002329446A|nr:phosphofructokinase [Rhizobium phage RHph_X2_28B]QWY83511.1 hypothetical protein [Rhizobium phage RHph_X2_28B]QWY83747.1 hypothetical protein [Rhizobium phage RHph_X3_15]